jgi:hypothetical protein
MTASLNETYSITCLSQHPDFYRLNGMDRKISLRTEQLKNRGKSNRHNSLKKAPLKVRGAFEEIGLDPAERIGGVLWRYQKSMRAIAWNVRPPTL